MLLDFWLRFAIILLRIPLEPWLQCWSLNYLTLCVYLCKNHSFLFLCLLHVLVVVHVEIFAGGDLIVFCMEPMLGCFRKCSTTHLLVCLLLSCSLQRSIEKQVFSSISFCLWVTIVDLLWFLCDGLIFFSIMWYR